MNFYKAKCVFYGCKNGDYNIDDDDDDDDLNNLAAGKDDVVDDLGCPMFCTLTLLLLYS